MIRFERLVEFEVVVRGGTVDYPYEDTWQETKTKEQNVVITAEVIADYVSNYKWRDYTEEQRRFYLKGINDLEDYSSDYISDFIDYDEGFQDFLKQLAAEMWNEDNRK
jgi:hypothetical protein